GGVAFTKDAVNLHAFYPHTFSLGAEEPAHGAVPEPVCWQARAARRARAGAVFRQRLHRAAALPAAVGAARARPRRHARVLAVREPDQARSCPGRGSGARVVTFFSLPFKEVGEGMVFLRAAQQCEPVPTQTPRASCAR